MPQPVLFVGAATLDSIAVVDRLPGSDERILASRIEHAGGGPSATAAVTARRLGLEVDVIAAVGDDVAGALVRDSLGAEGIDTSLIEVVAGRETQTSLILCIAGDGTRSIVTRAVQPLTLSSTQAARVRAAEWVHVDHLGWPAVEAVLHDVEPVDRPRILVDAGNAIVGDDSLCAIENVYAYVPPIARVDGAETAEQVADALVHIPSELAVVTLGEQGSIGRWRMGTTARAAGITTDEFVSSLGAGDVFHGALTAALFRDFALDDALAYANCVAALACRGLDGRSAIPSHNETLTWLGKDR